RAIDEPTEVEIALLRIAEQPHLRVVGVQGAEMREAEVELGLGEVALQHAVVLDEDEAGVHEAAAVELREFAPQDGAGDLVALRHVDRDLVH
ncbi:hypothetical protein LTR28_003179, partial [Elasticomyces elasticus]